MIPLILVSHSHDEAQKFIKDLAVSHAIPSFQIHMFKPDPNIITIDQIREVKILTSRSNVKKIVVLEDFDTTKAESQNALLKTLEEQSDSTVFLLLVHAYESLLPTIQSRCQLINLNAQKQIRIKTRDFSGINSIEGALDMSARLKKEKYIETIDTLILSLHTEMLLAITQEKHISSMYRTCIQNAFEQKKYIAGFNIQPEFAFDQLLIELDKQKYFVH